MYKTENFKSFFMFRERPQTGLYPVAFRIYSFFSAQKFKKLYGGSTKYNILISYGDRVKGAIVTKENFINIGNKILDKIIKNKKYINSKRKKSEIYAKRLGGYYKKFLESQDLSKYSNKELLNIYKEFMDDYENFNLFNLPFWLYGAEQLNSYLRNLLQTKIEDENKIQQYLTILTSSIEQSYVLKEEVMLLETLLKFKSRKKVDREIENLVKNFCFIPFDFLGPRFYDKKHYAKEFKKSTLNKIEIKNKINEIKNKKERLGKKQSSIKKSINLSDKEVRLFKDMQTIGIMQDEAKEFTTKAHVYFQKILLPEIAKRINLSCSLLIFMTPSEIWGSFNQRKNKSIR